MPTASAKTGDVVTATMIEAMVTAMMNVVLRMFVRVIWVPPKVIGGTRFRWLAWARLVPSPETRYVYACVVSCR